MTPATVSAGEGADTVVNQNFYAMSAAGMYGYRAPGSSALTWGFYGGRGFGNTIANGAVDLTASSTNYVVASRSTGLVTASTSLTNWNDTTNYFRLYLIVTGTATVTSMTDYREFLGSSSSGGGTAWGDLTGVPGPVEDIAALTDPGADRLLFWDDSAGIYTHLTLGTNLSITGTTINAAGGSGSGDVVGPAGSTADRIAAFDGTTGKLIKDGGKTIAELRSPSVQSVASAATVTPTFLDDMVKITAQAAALALANPTGTAIDGLGIVIRIKDNGTARAISYGSQYRAIGVTLPSTTVINKTMYLGCVWNADDTRLDVVAVGQEA
jgi:hypothetical protein